MIIRRAVPSDKQAIITLMKEVGPYFVPPLTTRTTLESYYNYSTGNNSEYIKEKYGDNYIPQNPISFVAIDPDTDQVIGFCASFGYFAPYNGAYMVCIMVSPSTWRKGVGTALVKESLDLLHRQDVHDLYLTTWSTNAASLKLWSKFDFTVYKKVPDEREPGVDGMYLKKDLSTHYVAFPNAIVSLA